MFLYDENLSNIGNSVSCFCILVHSFNNGNNNQKKNRVNNIRKNKIRRDLRGSTLRSLVSVLRFKIFESRKCFLDS